MRPKAALLALVCAATLAVTPAAFAQDAANTPDSRPAVPGQRGDTPVKSPSGTAAPKTPTVGGAPTAKAAPPVGEDCVGSTYDGTYAVGAGGTAHAGPGPVAGDVAPDQTTTATNDDGRAEVFAIAKSDRTLWKRWELSPQSDQWSPWVQAGPAMACRIAVGYNSDGRIELFGIRADTGEIWHSWQTAPNGGYSGWYPFSGAAKDVTVGRNTDGRMEIFARNPQTLEVYNIFQTRPSGGWSSWSKFSGPAGFVSIGRNYDGRMEVFAQNPGTREIWNTFQTRPSGPWAGWAKFSGPALDAKVARDWDGKQHIFARSPGTTNLFHVAQVGPNGRWGAWEQFGGATAATSVALTPFGLSVFAVDPAGRTLFERFQEEDQGYRFGDWFPLDPAVQVASPVTPGTSFRDNTMDSHLFAVTVEGRVVKTQIEQFSDGEWTWYDWDTFRDFSN